MNKEPNSRNAIVNSVCGGKEKLVCDIYIQHNLFQITFYFMEKGTRKQ